MVIEQQATHQGGISNGIKISVVDVPRMVKKRLKLTTKGSSDSNGQGDEPSYFTMFAAEFIGTGLLMFLGCMGCVDTYDEPQPTHHMGALAFGLTVMSIIQLFGHISGAHLNPAVTIASVLLGSLKPIMGLVYVVAQFVGATLGYGMLKILISDSYAPDGFCATTVDPKISVIQALGIEIIISTVLVMVCCAVWDKRNETKTDSTPLRFGLLIAVISMGAGPLTGASMNTARSFAPLVFGGSWSNHWIYWVGPNIAAFVGTALYKFVFGLPEDSDADQSKRESIYMDEVNSPSDKV